ncbi:hypothetical protein HZC30_00420 [Candidatus Woesearchaeota archaeon]|nr:hypothetical protein [Candidatus Woesearchaeota archaeon]
MVFSYKPFEIKLLKVGKISKHITKCNGKEYPKSKLYLHSSLNGLHYELYDMGNVSLQEWHGNIKGRGILIFLPNKPRKKKEIRM